MTSVKYHSLPDLRTVFLGEDNSVKLGDFGLSKVMQSHDFASTYVGTPFYMSPEICAAERYTLKSDVWSLGCIIYELCSREPPFNAKSHFQLVQKIKEGKISSLPTVYSKELSAVINDCLKVNPDRRPDTATLLNLPVVKLMRKEREVVELGRLLKTKEDLAAQRLREAEEKAQRIEGEKLQLESSLRREWEVKAQLEINRLVQVEIERLQKKYDQEVKEKVDAELQKRSSTHSNNPQRTSTRSATSVKEVSGPNNVNDIPLSSVGTSGDDDFRSSTDLTDLSVESPEPVKALKKSTRTPFGRAQTMFAGQPALTPMDVEMSEPSPISIASLSLSPRRNGATKAPSASRNIFAAAAAAAVRWQPTLITSDSEEDDDELALVPSPTRQKATKNLFKPAGGRPPLIAQKTAPVATAGQPSIYGAGKTAAAPSLPILSSAPDLRPQSGAVALKERSSSPNRRLSKIPSSTNLVSLENAPLSPTRKSSLKKAQSGTDDLSKLAAKNNMAKANSGGPANLAPRGRTLVELAQARAGGRPVEVSDGTKSPEPKGRAFAAWMAEKAGEKGEAPIWDPDRDEMPSPFLVRNRAPLRLG